MTRISRDVKTKRSSSRRESPFLSELSLYIDYLLSRVVPDNVVFLTEDNVHLYRDEVGTQFVDVDRSLDERSNQLIQDVRVGILVTRRKNSDVFKYRGLILPRTLHNVEDKFKFKLLRLPFNGVQCMTPLPRVEGLGGPKLSTFRRLNVRPQNQSIFKCVSKLITE